MTDVFRRLGENRPRTVAILSAGRVELFERRQPGEKCRQIVLTRAELGCAAVAIRARADELRLARQAIDVQDVHRRTRPVERTGSGRALGGGTLGLDAEVVIFDFEGGNLLGHAHAGGNGVLHCVAESGGGVDGGKHLAARRLDVGLEALDLALHSHVRRFLCCKRRRRLVAFRTGAHRGLAAGVELQASRFLPRVERAHFGLDLRGGRGQLLDLLAIERNLLLEAADLHLARVRSLARRRRLSVGLHQFETQPFERRFELGKPGGGRRLALTRAGELGSRGLDGLPERRGTSGRIGPSPSAAALRAGACSAAPWPPAASAFRAASRPRKRCRRRG